MLVDVLTIACGLGLAYVFLIIIDTVRVLIVNSIRAKVAKKAQDKIHNVYTYQNQQVEQPTVKGGKKKNETKH